MAMASVYFAALPGLTRVEVRISRLWATSRCPMSEPGEIGCPGPGAAIGPVAVSTNDGHRIIERGRPCCKPANSVFREAVDHVGQRII